MEVLWDIAIIVVVGGTGGITGYKIGFDRGLYQGIRETEKAYHYQLTSVLTRQRGTPEQERGSDDTG